jgi:hypothetical protein
MTIELVRNALGWCAIINIGVLLWWAFFIILVHDWTYRMHNRWFPLTVEQFNGIHYAGIMFFKISILFFNLVPYFALRIVG